MGDKGEDASDTERQSIIGASSPDKSIKAEAVACVQQTYGRVICR